jgi:hypothetical protein
MTTDILDQIKYFALLSIVGILSYFGKSQISRLDNLESHQKDTDKSLSALEMRTEKAIAILEVEMRNISQDIIEIKNGINKLINKLINVE